MGMEPSDYYYSFVLENLEDFRAEPESIRKAFNAATAAFQLADHVFAYYGRRSLAFSSEYPTKKSYLQFLESKCLDFIHVQSVATVYKHLYADGPIYTVASGGSLESVTMMDSVFHLAESSDLGGISEDVDISVAYEIGDNEKYQSFVVIKTRGGQRLAFLPILENVMSMWSDEISSRH